MADLSPVETLRAAAQKLRECGEAVVTESPWRVVVDESAEDDTAIGVWSTEETFVFKDADTMRVDAEWIALMHPGRAEPLAAWLEGAAADAEEIGADRRALRFARNLLGVPDGR